MAGKWAARAALAHLDAVEVRDRRALAEAQAAVARDVTAGRFPTWSALEDLAVAAPKVDLWDTLHRLHGLAVLDRGADADIAPSRLEVLRTEAGRVLDAAVRSAQVGRPTGLAGHLAEQGEQVAELSWARQVLDAVAHARDERKRRA